MQIEIWSDVVCPWCYIGRARLEQALEDFPGRDDVEIVFRSFQLDPGAPARPEQTVVDMLAAKYAGGDRAAAYRMVEQTEATAAEAGLRIAHAEAPHVNTFDAHRLLQLALEESGSGIQAALAHELHAAYFERAADVGDPDVLVAAATTVGLSAERVREVLVGEEYADAVRRDMEEGRALGATGVPFFVLDRRLGVPGAQPVDVMRRALEQAASA